MLLEVLVDPFVIFCIGCIAAPLFVNKGMNQEKVFEYFTNGGMLFAAALLVATWFITRFTGGPNAKLSYRDRMLARWYLLNGVIIHMLMDGLVGVFKVNKYFAVQYGMLDRRYGDPLGEFNGSAVHIVSLLELLVKGPICVLLYYCIHKGSRHRDALEFFTCITQAYGTVVYLGQEAISGGKNFDVDWKLEFTFHYIFYFWFAVVFGCVLYLIVPAIVGWRVYNRIVRATPSRANVSAVTARKNK
jgi:hypothetical protein